MSSIDFCEQLALLCSNSATGTMFLVTENQRQARIGISAGRIIHLGMRPVNGLAALNAIATTSFASFRFLDGAAAEAQSGLPETKVLLSMLRSGEVPTQIAQAAQATPSAPATKRATTELTPECLSIVEAEMVELFGPIAKMLVQEQRTRCATLDELFRALADNFDTKDEVAKFAARIKQRLGR